MGSCATNKEWSFAENKMFEVALAELDLNEPSWLEKLAAWVPSKTIDQVSDHLFDLVLDDINGVDASTGIHTVENNNNNNDGLISITTDNLQREKVDDPLGFLFMGDGIVLPSDEELMEMAMVFGDLGDLIKSPVHQANSCDGSLNKQPAAAKKNHVPAGPEKVIQKPRDRKGRRGTSWTESEHRLFLIGLIVYGRGDWRSIARHFVKTRTPTQVASHAQKYFIRHERPAKGKRRPSIHDIRNIIAPIVFGSRTQSIYDMIDWGEVAARYWPSSADNSSAINNGAPGSQFCSQLVNCPCPAAANNGEASSSAESTEELGSCINNGDAMGIDSIVMEEENWDISYLLRSPVMPPVPY